jgi:hypothetical protein
MPLAIAYFNSPEGLKTVTDIFHQESFTLVPLAPLASAPTSSGGGSGPGLGARISNDWSASRRDNEANVRKERRSAVERARHSVEAGWSRPGQLTKQERLAASKSSGKRQTGGLQERRDTLGSVAKAVAAVSSIPSDTEFSTDEFRLIRETLRQRYPGAKLSEMLQEGARMEQMLLDDPVNAHQHLFAAYSRAKAAPGYVEPEHAHGVRGSVARARQDQEDAEDLKDWIARFGKRLPAILAELEFTDRSLRANPNYAAAQLAARHGAPILEAEIPAYEARQLQKNTQARFDNIHAGICTAIEHGHLPSDEDTLSEMAAVIALPAFRHSNDQLETLQRAAKISRHPDHKRLTPRAPAKAGSNAGSRSISGANTSGDRPLRGNGEGVRASIERAHGRI